jgi:hypothetical protein
MKQTIHFDLVSRLAVVSRWLPTAGGRVRSQVRSCGICGEQSGIIIIIIIIIIISIIGGAVLSP